MTTTVLIAILSLIIVILLFLVIRSTLSSLDFKNRLHDTEQALARLHSTEAKLLEESAALKTKLQQTFEDPITHTLSWKVFEDRLTQSIKESERHQLTLGVLLVDIDEFRVINDALGHEVGDQLLKEVAARLETCIRQVDSLARFNKDTFAILLSQLGKPEGAAVVAQRILQTLKESVQIDGHELFVTVGMGISIYPTDGKDAGIILNNAVEALRIAKQKEKNSYQFYQEQMHVQSQRELSLHMSLSRESIFNEFIVYYQPIVNVEKEEVFCLDALLYWQHPQLGLINSDELTTFAEKQRKNNAITEWLLRHACQQFLYWRSLGFVTESLGITISISQLMNTHFIYRISQLLQELKFNPEWLLIEIKEGATILAPEILDKAFNMLNYIGVRIAIDRFGADSLSLNELKKIPVQYLKLTPVLIDDIEQNPQTMGLLKAIFYLAKTLSMEVICTGVESSEQINLLKSIGSVLMQGQQLSAPLLPTEIEATMVTSTE